MHPGKRLRVTSQVACGEIRAVGWLGGCSAHRQATHWETGREPPHSLTFFPGRVYSIGEGALLICGGTLFRTLTMRYVAGVMPLYLQRWPWVLKWMHVMLGAALLWVSLNELFWRGTLFSGGFEGKAKGAVLYLGKQCLKNPGCFICFYFWMAVKPLKIG